MGVAGEAGVTKIVPLPVRSRNAPERPLEQILSGRAPGQPDARATRRTR